MDRLLQDVRFAARSLVRAPGFTAIALLTLALGIGANTAIFSIVNGVILRPLAYPKPEQLMYLTTQFPGLGFEQFWVSPPEYMEFRELNQSFAAVGAYRTAESNLTAGDRPLRVRTALVDEHLFAALGVPAAQGRLFAKGEAEVSGPAPAPGQPAPQTQPIVVLSHELWQTAFGGRPIVGETIEINGRRREVIGILPPGTDVMDNRTEIWLPLGLNPANRQNRGSHNLYLVGRLKDGVTPASAQTELNALIANWGSRVGIPTGEGPGRHVFVPLKGRNGHILQMEPLQEEMLGSAGRSIWVLQAAVGFVLLIACANLANLLLARAESRHREFAVRTAIGATRWRLLRQFMTEGLLLSLIGGVLGVLTRPRRRTRAAQCVSGEPSTDQRSRRGSSGAALYARRGDGHGPARRPRAADAHACERPGHGAQGRRRQRCDERRAPSRTTRPGDGRSRAGCHARHRRRAAAAHGLQPDAGGWRIRPVAPRDILDDAAAGSVCGSATAFARSRACSSTLRASPGVQGATGMTGLPPERPLNANDTDIDGYTAPPEGPYENVDYYQGVMSDYFETMGIPIVQGRSFERTDAASTGRVAVVNETLVNTFWKGSESDRTAASAMLRRPDPVVHRGRRGQGCQAGRHRSESGTEFYQLIDQCSRWPWRRKRSTSFCERRCRPQRSPRRSSGPSAT